MLGPGLDCQHRVNPHIHFCIAGDALVGAAEIMVGQILKVLLVSDVVLVKVGVHGALDGNPSA